LIRVSLEARQEALSTAVARLLVQNNEIEQEATAQTSGIYTRAERNLYLFVALMLILIVSTTLYLVQYNRKMFDRVAALSERRSELARQLIGMQESTFRSISRELHDDFGQILTAVGVMLQRTERRAAAYPTSFAPISARSRRSSNRRWRRCAPSRSRCTGGPRRGRPRERSRCLPARF